MPEKKVKFVEEKMLNKQKKIWRSKDRLYKYEEKDDAKVMEDPPQTRKEIRTPRTPSPPMTPPSSTRGPFAPLKLEHYIGEPEPEPEPEIKWWNNKIIRDEYDFEDTDSWFD